MDSTIQINSTILFQLRQGLANENHIDPYLSLQDYTEIEAGKVVIYTTTLGVIRETYARQVIPSPALLYHDFD